MTFLTRILASMGLARLSFSYQYYLDLVQVLVGKELKIRYKGTVLGYAWSILHPLVFALVYFVVFKIVMRIKMDNYALFLIGGLFPWQWFSNGWYGGSPRLSNEVIRFDRV